MSNSPFTIFSSVQSLLIPKEMRDEYDEYTLKEAVEITAESATLVFKKTRGEETRQISIVVIHSPSSISPKLNVSINENGGATQRQAHLTLPDNLSSNIIPILLNGGVTTTRWQFKLLSTPSSE